MEENKMVKISDICKSEPAFTDVNTVKADEILNKPLKIKAVAKREGDGEYYIFKADCDNKEISFSNGGKAVVEKINKVVATVEKTQEAEGGVITFNEPVEATLVKKKSQATNRQYYDFE
jgi:YbbR domain-containing protein